MKRASIATACWTLGCLLMQNVDCPGAAQLASGAHPGLEPVESRGDSFHPVLSADARYVIFGSQADDLTADGPDDSPDVFRFDRLTGELRLISDVPLPPRGQGAEVSHFSVSGSGTKITYAAGSEAVFSVNPFPTLATVIRDLAAESTLVPVEPDLLPNFVRPLNALDARLSATGNRLYFVSHPVPLSADTNKFAALRHVELGTGEVVNVWLPLPQVAGTNVMPGIPTDAHIDVSPDGRFATWQLAFTPVNGQLRDEVLFFDTQTQTITQLSPHQGDDQDTWGHSAKPVVSDDGRWVAFESRSTNLVVGQSAMARRQVFLHDRTTQSTVLVNTNHLGQAATDGDTAAVEISGDGRWLACFSDVALTADDSNQAGDVFLRDHQDGSILRISTHPEWQGSLARAAVKPVLSPDGEWTLYQSPGSGLFLYQRSTGLNTLITSDVESDVADMTPDGAWVVFTAKADSMNPASTSSARNVYLWNRLSGASELITRRHPNYKRSLPAAGVQLVSNGVSDDGRRLLFRSAAGNLVPDQPPAVEALWVRDLTLRTNLPVAVFDEHYRATGPRPFSDAALSRDGRFVAYLAQRTNLPPEGLALPGWDDLWVRDLETGDTHLVTRSRTGSFTGSSSAFGISLSTDGNRVAFSTPATNLGASAPADAPGIYVWDRATDALRRLVDTVKAPYPALHSARLVTISPDGNRIAFVARQPTELTGRFYVQGWDDPEPTEVVLPGEVLEVRWSADSSSLGLIALSASGSTRRPHHVDVTGGLLVTTPQFLEGEAVGISLDATGEHLAFLELYGTTAQIRIWKPQAGALGTASQVLHNDFWFRRAQTELSADGRWLACKAMLPGAYVSDYRTLEQRLHLRLWDRVNDTLTIVDRSIFDDAAGRVTPGTFALGATGLRLFFDSHQPDATPLDDNLARDVFFVELVAEDADLDGLADDWELAYFDTLERDGTGDHDGDTSSDADEYRAGTVPIQSSSVLAVTQLRRLAGDERELSWRSVPGKRYRVQAKNSLGTPTTWGDRSGVITATATTTVFIDVPVFGVPLPDHRYYRVTLEE